MSSFFFPCLSFTLVASCCHFLLLGCSLPVAFYSLTHFFLVLAVLDFLLSTLCWFFSVPLFVFPTSFPFLPYYLSVPLICIFLGFALLPLFCCSLTYFSCLLIYLRPFLFLSISFLFFLLTFLYVFFLIFPHPNFFLLLAWFLFTFCCSFPFHFLYSWRFSLSSFFSISSISLIFLLSLPCFTFCLLLFPSLLPFVVVLSHLFYSFLAASFFLPTYIIFSLFFLSLSLPAYR